MSSDYRLIVAYNSISSYLNYILSILIFFRASINSYYLSFPNSYSNLMILRSVSDSNTYYIDVV